MKGSSFVPMLPYTALITLAEGDEALVLVSRMTADLIPDLDEELWSGWKVMEKLLKVLDVDIILFFNKFLRPK